jgi:hypothetical protein
MPESGSKRGCLHQRRAPGMRAGTHVCSQANGRVELVALADTQVDECWNGRLFTRIRLRDGKAWFATRGRSISGPSTVKADNAEADGTE